MNYGQGGGGVPPGYTQPGGSGFNTQPGSAYGQAPNPYGQPPNPYGQPANAYAPMPQQQMAPPKSNVGLIIGIVAGVLGLGLVGFLLFIFVIFRAASSASSTPTRTSNTSSQTSTDNSNTELSLSFLQRVAEDGSVGLPRMLDAETREEAVTALPGTIVYHNKLVNKSVRQLDVPVFMQVLKPSIVANDCANNALRNSLLKKGVTLRYTYVDRNSSFIASLDITKHDCGL